MSVSQSEGGKGVIKEGMLMKLALAVLAVGSSCLLAVRLKTDGALFFFFSQRPSPEAGGGIKAPARSVGLGSGTLTITTNHMDHVPESSLMIDKAKYPLGLVGEDVLRFARAVKHRSSHPCPHHLDSPHQEKTN